MSPCSRFTQEELLAIDLEGRCVITDHGQFILFNLYGPAITNEESAEERFAYKLRLYKVSQACSLTSKAASLQAFTPLLPVRCLPPSMEHAYDMTHVQALIYTLLILQALQTACRFHKHSCLKCQRMCLQPSDKYS